MIGPHRQCDTSGAYWQVMMVQPAAVRVRAIGFDLAGVGGAATVIAGQTATVGVVGRRTEPAGAVRIDVARRRHAQVPVDGVTAELGSTAAHGIRRTDGIGQALVVATEVPQAVHARIAAVAAAVAVGRAVF
jgi:hypothetical protein